MADQRLPDQHRAMALAALDRIERELGQLSTWLSGLDEDRAAEMLECATRDAAAAGWQLERRRVTYPPHRVP